VSRRILALFAKAPVPGQVKTRLSPPLSSFEAARFYEAMLLDIIAQHAAAKDADLALWYSPREAGGWFENVVPDAYRLFVQEGGHLASRMERLFRVHAEEGYGRIVLRGTDSPTLPRARVAEAFRALNQFDLVLCPDRDGGYNLIGLRKPCDALFDLEMSTASVMEKTLVRARAAGLRVEVLPAHHDVDTPSDLALLQHEISDDLAPRTRRWVEQWLRGTRVSIDS
jgi:rSAM/selenodomain-associated transferase 1